VKKKLIIISPKERDDNNINERKGHEDGEFFV